jgi:hypothetical protein
VTHLDPFVERVVERGLRTLRGAPVPAPAGPAAFIAADDFTGGGVLDVGAVAAGPKVLAGPAAATVRRNGPQSRSASSACTDRRGAGSDDAASGRRQAGVGRGV